MSQPIAIVGMGCLFPDARTPEQYWQNLLDKRDSCSVLTPELIGTDPAVYYDEKPGTPDKICYHKNGHIRDFEFDPHGYRLPANYLDGLDALFKWTLYAAGEAARDAGLDPQRSRACGLVLGNIGMPTHAGKRTVNGFYGELLEPYVRSLLGDERFRFHAHWESSGRGAEADLSTASRNVLVAADALGLGGPAYAMDAACSSALYAINTASAYLRTGQAEVMLAGSVCHADHIYIDHGFNMLHAFPGVGQSSVPFDRHSAGLKAGEGAGVVALKLLSAAERDGDRIHGVIEAVGLSNDGGAKHILVPDVDGQLLALRRAYGEREPDIDYLECHATGTPVGDQVELNSIERFFDGPSGMPLLGANKGNVGHLLTASGMASLIKVLLAIRNATIPGTIDVEEMVVTKGRRISIGQVVRETTRWPAGGKRKRAGINAFGFGGVNGHMIIAEHAGPSGALGKPPCADWNGGGTAIVGMSVTAGRTNLLGEFNRAVLKCEEKLEPLPRTRWSGVETRGEILERYALTEPPNGAYIESFEFDCKRFKLPPNMAGLHLLSHMSLMQLAAGAFHDAGYEVGTPRKNIAVIVAADDDYLCYRYQARNEMAWQLRDSLRRCGIALSETELTKLERVVKDSLFPEPYLEGITGGIGNVVASRISACLKLDGPSFTLCSRENSVFRAIEVARLLLEFEKVDAVIVGSGSFDGGLENVLFSNAEDPADTSGCGFGFDGESNGKRIGEGGGVVVLKRHVDALAARDRIYATVKSLCLERDTVPEAGGDPAISAPGAATMVAAARGCLSRAGVTADSIGYVEASASGHRDHDAAEIDALRAVYGSCEDGPVVGSVKVNYGHLGAASGIASVIKTALCLYHRYLPGTPGWDETRRTKRALGSLRPLSESRSWESRPSTAAPSGRPRYAAINSVGSDRTCCHLLLEEPDAECRRPGEESVSAETLRENALLKTIHVGRERTIREFILDNDQGLCVGFASPGASPSPPAEAAAGEAAESSGGEPVRRTHVPVVTDPDTVYPDTAAPDTAAPVAAAPDTATLAELVERMRVRQIERNIATHRRYLELEGRCNRQLTRLLQTRAATAIAETASGATSEVVPGAVERARRRPTVLLDREQLVELTDGSVARVLGERYREADLYPIRTRMPSPPYLFVSRITALDAEYGKLEPSVIEWEFDLDVDSWFVFHGMVPAFVTLESSHAMIVAFTLIGCDQMFKGQLQYRAVDSRTTIYSDLPRAGEVLRGRVRILSFTRLGPQLLINYEYDGFVGERHSFRLTATSGFFSAKDMAKSKRVDTSRVFGGAIRGTPLVPPLRCGRTSFADEDVAIVQCGELEKVFGEGYGRAEAPALHAPMAKMLDRVPHIDPSGGAWGLGQLLGEYSVDPGHWAFEAHFKNDPVLPGTLIVEGAEQLMRFYFYYIGLHTLRGMKPLIMNDHTYSAKFRGEVKHRAGELTYRLTVKKVDAVYTDTGELSELSILFVSETIHEGRVIGICDDLGSRFVRASESDLPSRQASAAA